MKYNKITIDSHKLEKIIDKYYPKKGYDFISIGSLLVALITTIVTTQSFKNYGEIFTAKQIEFFFYFALVFSIIWLCRTLYLYFYKNTNAKEELLKEIETVSVNISKDIYLFIIMYQHEELHNLKDTKMLFYFDKEWDMYMVPYCNKNENIDKVCGFIANQLSIPKETITIERIEELNIKEEKYSISKGGLTSYNYTTFFVSYEFPIDSYLLKKEINIAGRIYKWFNINEIKEEHKTMYQNREVIKSIDHYWSHIIMNYIA